VLAATTSRLIALRRGWFGGFEYTDLRWQDLKEAHISVGVVGATLRLVAESSSDLASAQNPDRRLCYAGLRPEQAQAVYRICQAQDQAWREKRRIREIEELRARSGGVQIVGGATPAGAGAPGGDAMERLEQARRMVEARLISDAEYEAIKAKILSGHERRGGWSGGIDPCVRDHRRRRLAIAAFADGPGGQKELIALEGTRREAIRRHDFTRLEQIYDPAFVAVAGNGQIIDRAQLFAVFRQADPAITYATSEPQVHVSGPTAVFIGRLIARSASGDTLSDARFSHVFVKRGREWRCIAGQSTPVTGR
jgi:ketosteroid isomerase-like protein